MFTTGDFARRFGGSARASTLSLALLISGALPAHAGDRFEEPPINYSAATPDNPAAALRDALRANPALISYDDKFGRLKGVLEFLKVPIESQVLVFSKTSLQIRHISPTNPRALYFNDDIYVGTVPNGDVIEVSAADPKLGAVFYTLTQHESDPVELVRQVDNCLQCHGSTMTGGNPGHIMRSVYTDISGYPILSGGSYVTTQNSPFAERWGGWYVTGTNGPQRHMGNAIAEPAEIVPKFDAEAGANLLSLLPRVDPGKYLTPHSDLVALLVLAHQTHLHNLLTQANFDTVYALRDQAVLDEILQTPAGELSDSTRRRIESSANKLIECMLFAQEQPLAAPVKGTAGFAEKFAAAGPRDPQGRSLRDFDLETRLFKYPLSYLIYSPQFDGLPAQAKDYIYKRLWAILTGAAPNSTPVQLTPPLRDAIREILRDTKPGLPDYWK